MYSKAELLWRSSAKRSMRRGTTLPQRKALSWMPCHIPNAASSSLEQLTPAEVLETVCCTNSTRRLRAWSFTKYRPKHISREASAVALSSRARGTGPPVVSATTSRWPKSWLSKLLYASTEVGPSLFTPPSFATKTSRGSMSKGTKSPGATVSSSEAAAAQASWSYSMWLRTPRSLLSSRYDATSIPPGTLFSTSLIRWATIWR
mmetsp:Transcript_20000/g.37167  ORF Transcript_20000/g.37167 Transcript_20000/m.37167 type:complete len:204 (-) Transcript_20000:1322-1933(-)